MPRIPTWLLANALPARHRQHWLGDLAEEFHRHVLPRRGQLRARIWYWRQALGSLPAAVRRRAIGPDGREPDRDRHRELAGLVDGLLLDLRSAVRALSVRPAFTLVAIGTLALGIGANVAVFSVVRTTVIDQLPYVAAEDLVRFSPDGLFPIDSADFSYLRDSADSGLQMSAYGRSLLTFTGGAEPEMVRGAAVSSNHFDVLGVSPLHGRVFRPGEGNPGADRIVILSFHFWNRRWGGDESVVGSSVEIQGQAWHVAGVMGPEYHPLEWDWQFWIPLADEPERDRAVAAIGRLSPVVPAEAATEFYRNGLVERWRSLEYVATPDERASMYAAPLRDWLLGPWQSRLLLLLGAVTLVLIIACANVGNLVLARTTGRFDELGLRVALGAGRARLVRLLLVESGLLAGAGALLGIGGAWVLVEGVRSAIPEDVPRATSIGIDMQVLGYAVLLTVLSALVFGAAPAIRASTRGQASSGSRRSTAEAAESRMSRAFVAAQVALSVVLVIGAGLLLRSFWQLQSVDPGFRAEGVVALRPAPPSASYPAQSDVRTYHENVRSTLAGLRGVRAVGGIMFLPMNPGGWWTSFTIEDRPDDAAVGAAARVVTDGYFAAMEIPLLAGRDFQSADTDGQPVAIINDTLARTAFAGEDPLGQMLLLGDGSRRRVVGVVGDVRQEELATPANPELYVPYSQRQWRNMYFTVRVDGAAADYVSRIRDAVRSIDPRVPINGLAAMSDVVQSTSAGQRFLAAFVVAFGVVALALGMIGVYGVTAYAVARQRRDIGIRMAVGAAGSQVLRQTLLRGFAPVLVGLLLGVGGAAVLSRFVQGMLFEVAPLDPRTFAAVPALLVAAALVALWFPARSATRVDPASIMRES